MKKKLFGFLMLVFSVFALVACSSKSELDGEYYWIDEGGRLDWMLTISEGGGVVNGEEGDYSIVNVDTDKKQIIVSTSKGEVSLPYIYEDGIIRIDITGVERDYYKKGTKAFEEAMEKYGYTEADLEE